MDGFVFLDSLVLIEVVEWDGVEPQAFSNNLTQMASLSFSLTQLHYFVAAAHTLNLTRAARECHVSQPSISGAVHHLEEMFCTQLFHRDPSRGLSLTTSGTQLQELAESLLAQAHQLESQMNPGTSEEALKVGCLMTLEALIMPAMIQLFQERSPGIMLAHETAHQQELLEWVYRGAVELTYDMQIAEGMGFTPLGEAQLPPYAILAPDSSWAQQDAISLLELAEQPLVLLDLPMSRDYFFPSSRIWGCAPRSPIGRHR
ncbi:MAG TPA: LysR family transcriptional regulator [Deltaproteobacteria bacterium]|nr:LysR family transcriptional regulator [Deltaproteobacteria bacterium]